MKATGIVRRIDELGRVVIPKEIRRTQRIRRGDPLEIFTTGDGEVIFKKYSPIGEMNTVAAQYTEVLSKSFGGFGIVKFAINIGITKVHNNSLPHLVLLKKLFSRAQSLSLFLFYCGVQA